MLARLWTDGRYFIQAVDQLDCNWQMMKMVREIRERTLQFLLYFFRAQMIQLKTGFLKQVQEILLALILNLLVLELG